MSTFADSLDMTPRYAPTADLFSTPGGFRYCPVTEYLVHPPGAHPKGCPLIPSVTVLELRTTRGIRSRWYGCASAHINSELKMVVIGTHPRDEVRMKWPVCTEV